MNWLVALWLVIASMCVTLAVIHVHVWLRQRKALGNAAFAVLALSVVGMGYCEMRMLHAQTTQEFARFLWWYQVPVWSGLVASIVFVRVYLHAGPAWLGWAAIGLRTLALMLNFFMTPSIQFREITALDSVTVYGDTLRIAQGAPNPWLAVAHLSLVALIAFIAGAIRDLWRRGQRRRAVTIGGSLIVFVTAGTTSAVIGFWGLAKWPVFASLLFLPIVLAMAFELGLDLIEAARVAAELAVKRDELRQSEEQASLAADAANAGLWSIDRGSGRVWATPRALAMFGLAPTRAAHVDDVLAAIHAEDRTRVAAFVARAVPQEARDTIEYRVVLPDGTVRWYASLARVPVEEQGPARLMGATIDISERKLAEDATARQRAELEHLSRVATLTELSGTLAHELNQPLGIIMSNAEAAQRLLEADAPDLAEVGEILADIVAADERAGQVIQRMRSFLQRRAPARKRISLNRAVEDVVQFLRADLARRGVTVTLALDRALPDIEADPVPIEQVLVNIVTNGCDAMGTVARDARVLAIATGVEGDMACVRIADTGCGLPESPERLFAPFYTTKADGLGMGLAISRSIVAAHGGRLWAESNAARGATFAFGLPPAPAPVPAATAEVQP